MNSASIFSDADVLEPEILAKADFYDQQLPAMWFLNRCD
jgi:hypothetical protein